MDEITKDDVSFYAHTVIRGGIKSGYWEKVGKSSFDGKIDVIFRQINLFAPLYLDPPKDSAAEDWKIWRVNEPMIEVKNTSYELQNSERGSVKPAIDIINRVKTGKYAYFEHRFQ